MRDLAERGELRVNRVPTEENGANALTKKLSRPQLEKERELCGVFKRDVITDEQAAATRERETHLIKEGASGSNGATGRDTHASVATPQREIIRMSARVARAYGFRKQ